jgi:tetratricopeptide (TPR) repeat protein
VSSPISDSKNSVLVVCILLVLAVFLVFGQTLRHEFVNYDDDQYFYSNPQVRAGLTWRGVIWAFETPYADNWHPLTWLSLMLDAQLFGTGPVGPHLTNVLLHAANAVFLFVLLRRLTGAHWRSAFVAAVFAIHPLRVESVAWVAERKDVLSGLFFMLTLLMYTRYVETLRAKSPTSTIFYGWAVLCFAFGLVSKPMLVTLPFLMLLLDWWPLRRLESSTIARVSAEKLPFLILSAASCLTTFVVQQGARKPMEALPVTWRIGNAMVSYVYYLGQMFYPVGLAVSYPHPGRSLPRSEAGLALVLVVGIFAGVFACRRKQPYLLTGWLWYIGMLVPVIGLVQVGFQSHADRYTYLPQIGLYLLIAWAAGDMTAAWRDRRQILGATAFSAITVLAVCASVQASYWRSSESLWTHTLSCTHGNYLAHNSLGTALASRGRFAEAIDHYRKALQIKPDYTPAHCNLGTALLAQGRSAEAIEEFQTALKIDPECAAAHNGLGGALAVRGQSAAAIRHYRKAIQTKPDYTEAYYNLAFLLAAQGLSAEAIQYYQQAIRLKPDDASAHYNVGVLLALQGRLQEAVEEYRKAIQIKPDYADAYGNLANVLVAQGRLDDAIKNYELTLVLAPNSAQAHYKLGLALQSQKRFDLAIAQYREALRINPNHTDARYNLGLALRHAGEVQESTTH